MFDTRVYIYINSMLVRIADSLHGRLAVHCEYNVNNITADEMIEYTECLRRETVQTNFMG